MTFTLRDVPAAMRKEGWPVGAQLMERWFNAPAYAMDLRVKTGDTPPRANATESGLTSMAWVLGFARARDALVQLQAEWASPARLGRSTPVIEGQLRRWVAANKTAGQSFRFGNLGGTTLAVDQSCAINYQSVDSNWYGPVDDFYAALGRAAIKVAVSGMVVADGANWRLTIDEAAYYMRDTYDFIGDQRLGSWGPDGFSRAAIAAPDIEVDPNARPGFWDSGAAYFTVDNAAFRRWRGLFNHGGDFVVFSDLQRARLATPVVVTVPR